MTPFCISLAVQCLLAVSILNLISARVQSQLRKAVSPLRYNLCTTPRAQACFLSVSHFVVLSPCLWFYLLYMCHRRMMLLPIVHTAIQRSRVINELEMLYPTTTSPVQSNSCHRAMLRAISICSSSSSRQYMRVRTCHNYRNVCAYRRMIANDKMRAHAAWHSRHRMWRQIKGTFTHM